MRPTSAEAPDSRRKHLEGPKSLARVRRPENGRPDFEDIAGFQSLLGSIGLSSAELSAAIEAY